MNVVATSSNGVVDHEAIFTFRETGNQVSAEYSGGKISVGFLVGTRQLDTLYFAYCQRQVDGRLDHGNSIAKLTLEAGKIRMTETFEWRDGLTGENVFEEI